MKKHILMAMFFALSCSPVKQESSVVSVNSKMSACGVTEQLGNQSSSIIPIADTSYCKAERLYWALNTSTNTLVLLHTRLYRYEGTHLALSVRKENSRYVIEEEEKNNIPSLSLCYYNVSCELPLPSRDSITLQFDSLEYGINPTTLSGEFAIRNDRVSCESCLWAFGH